MRVRDDISYYNFNIYEVDNIGRAKFVHTIREQNYVLAVAKANEMGYKVEERDNDYLLVQED